MLEGKGRRKNASTTKVYEVVDRFHREILLVSALSSTISIRATWLVDSGESCHMTGSRELFDTFIEIGLDLCVKLGTGARHVV